MPLHDPPTYQEVSTHGLRAQLPSQELFSLRLDGHIICSTEQPSLVYYELSAAVCDGTSLVNVIRKVRYRLSNKHGDGDLRAQSEDIYVFRDSRFSFSAHRNIVIVGRENVKRSYKQVKLSPGITSWSTCKATGHFKADIELSSW